jgi:hypothetical protein
MFSRKLSILKTNKTNNTLTQILLSLNHYVATSIYICNLNTRENGRNVKPPLENKNKFRRTARRKVI